MSLKRNVLANYVGQLYVTLIGILFVPIYVKLLGTEAYGLVGFYAMLQAWFMLLDMGLTPTMARETARFQGGAIDARDLRRLLRALEGVFILIALLGALAMLFGSNFIASSWLKVQQLPLIEVKNAIMLMGVIASLRWVCGLYRGVISGFERMVWLNAFNIVIATLRFALIIPFLIYVGSTLIDFFCYQLIIAVIEVVILVKHTYRMMPELDSSERIKWEWQPLSEVVKFSLSVAASSAVWVMITQTDKLILSGLIPLSDYAYFTLASLVAGGITVISAPLSVALLPRMSKLNAQVDAGSLIRLYRNTTQMVAVIAIPAALVLAFFAEQVLWAWTGNIEIAHKAATVLTLYALGNCVMVLAAFPYYLQFAKGDLRLHLIGNALFVLIFIPILFWGVRKYGMLGAGYAWIIANLLPFIIWLPIVHSRFVKGLHTQWLLKDICSIMVLPTITAYVLQKLIVWPETRLSVALDILIISIVLSVIAAISSSCLRDMIQLKWLESFAKKQ